MKIRVLQLLNNQTHYFVNHWGFFVFCFLFFYFNQRKHESYYQYFTD